MSIDTNSTLTYSPIYIDTIYLVHKSKIRLYVLFSIISNILKKT